jgi:uncharacterized membrane protein
MSGRPATPPGSLDLEGTLARVLQAGTTISIGLVMIGTVLLIGGGTSPLAAGPKLTLDRLVGDVLALRPEGFLWLGILGTIATPLLRVGGALVGFWRRSERRMVVVALLIFSVVAAGVAAGVLSG